MQAKERRWHVTGVALCVLNVVHTSIWGTHFAGSKFLLGLVRCWSRAQKKYDFLRGLGSVSCHITHDARGTICYGQSCDTTHQLRSTICCTTKKGHDMLRAALSRGPLLLLDSFVMRSASRWGYAVPSIPGSISGSMSCIRASVDLAKSPVVQSSQGM